MTLPETAPYIVGSETSEEAAENIAPRLSRLRQRVYDTLRSFGPLTDEDLCNVTGLSASTVRPRRGELVDEAFVVDSGERRKVASGNRATLWRVTTPDEREQILRRRQEERDARVDRVGELEELLSRWLNLHPCRGVVEPVFPGLPFGVQVADKCGECLTCRTGAALKRGGS